MHHDDLQTLVDRALSGLPAPKAPSTLLPRVMAAAAALHGRPWYTRAWLTWPLGVQVASAAVLIAVLGGLAVLLPDAGPALARALGVLPADEIARVSETARAIGEAGTRVGTAASAISIVWRAVLAPAMFYSIAIMALMLAACFAFGTALQHVALGKAIPR